MNRPPPTSSSTRTVESRRRPLCHRQQQQQQLQQQQRPFFRRSTTVVRIYFYTMILFTVTLFAMVELEYTTRNNRSLHYLSNSHSNNSSNKRLDTATTTTTTIKNNNIRSSSSSSKNSTDRWVKVVPSREDETTWRYDRRLSSSSSSSRNFEDKPVMMTVIILTMDRFESLERMLLSLHNADYRSIGSSNNGNGNGTDYSYDRVDLVVKFDRLPPSKATIAGAIQQRKHRIQKLCKDYLSKWKYGQVQVVLSKRNLGLAESWFRAWSPSSSSTASTASLQEQQEPRALILEDDLELSPIWYRWLRGVHDAYGSGGRHGQQQQQQRIQNDDVGAFSLSHQELVPLKDKTKKKPSTDHFPKTEPFLYALLGSHGFSPIAHVWTEFIDFVRCTKQQQLEQARRGQSPTINVLTPDLITSDWFEALDHRGMWTQHFIYFCKQRGYYNMYQFPQTKAIAAHWQEKGEHFDGSSRGRNFDLVQEGDIPFVYPPQPKKYDWGANLIVDNSDKNQHPDRPVVIMSAAVGYKLEDFYPFVDSLRRVYSGDVMLLISSTAPTEVTSYLETNNIGMITTIDPGQHCNGCAGWEQLNRARFSFFRQVCDKNKYTLCLTTDFRDSMFQYDPFEGIHIPSLERKISMLFRPRVAREERSLLYVYEHNTPMNQWHYEKMDDRKCRLYKKYRSYLENTNIINGGSIISSPDVYRHLVNYMTKTWKGCNDQVVLNILVRAKMMPSQTKVIVSPQGVGNMNVVGYGGKIIKGEESDRFLNLNCFPSPVVHQYDIADLT